MNDDGHDMKLYVYIHPYWAWECVRLCMCATVPVFVPVPAMVYGLVLCVYFNKNVEINVDLYTEYILAKAA